MKKISPKIADFQEFSLLHCNSWRHALQICKETPDGSATLQILQSAKSERALVGSRSSVANLVDPARHLLATLLLYCENPAIFSTEALKRGFLCFCYQTEQRKDNAILLSHIFNRPRAKLLISDFEGKIRNFAFLTIFTWNLTFWFFREKIVKLIVISDNWFDP